LNKTVWFNVTTSLNWKRPPVGVVRVERSVFEQLRQLADLGLDVKPCYWNGNAFVAVELPSQEAAASTPLPSAEQATSAVPQHAPAEYLFQPVSKREAAKQLAHSLFSLVPAGVRPHADRILRHSKTLAVKYVLWRGRQAAHGYRMPSLPLPLESGRPLGQCPFQPGDIFVSMGLDWDAAWYQQLHDIKRKYGIKIVTCCYDLIPVLFPQYCVGDVAEKFTSYFVDLAHGSDLILCISKQTQKDLRQLLDDTGAPDTDTAVFPLGDNVPVATEPPSDELRRITERPFILFVSTIERRKNHQLLYKAYHLLCAQGHADVIPNLVFVGMGGWGVGDLLMDINLDPLTKGKIFQFTHITDSALRYLYEQCEYFVYPSLYEGWGLPVGEALSLGKAVLASDQGSLPEVGGDLVTYLDAWNPRPWAEAILELSLHPEKVAAMAAGVRECYRPRTWKDAAVVVGAQLAKLAQNTTTPLTLLPGYDLSTEVGLHVGPHLYSKGEPGWLMFGPHRLLAAGTHQIRVLIKPVGTAVFELDVVGDQGASCFFAQQYECSGAEGEQLLNFEVQLERVAVDFEVRCKLIKGNLEIQRVEIAQQATSRAAGYAGV